MRLLTEVTSWGRSQPRTIFAVRRPAACTQKQSRTSSKNMVTNAEDTNPQGSPPDHFLARGQINMRNYSPHLPSTNALLQQLLDYQRWRGEHVDYGAVVSLEQVGRQKLPSNTVQTQDRGSKRSQAARPCDAICESLCCSHKAPLKLRQRPQSFPNQPGISNNKICGRVENRVEVAVLLRAKPRRDRSVVPSASEERRCRPQSCKG